MDDISISRVDRWVRTALHRGNEWYDFITLDMEKIFTLIHHSLIAVDTESDRPFRFWKILQCELMILSRIEIHCVAFFRVSLAIDLCCVSLLLVPFHVVHSIGLVSIFSLLSLSTHSYLFYSV